MKTGVTVSAAAAVLAVLANPGVATASPVPMKDVPAGTSYWINKTDVLATKRKGRTLKVGNPLTPCFTGKKVGPNKYRGGGMDQQGTYSRQVVTVSVKGSKLRINNSWSVSGKPLKYRKSTRAKVAKRYGGTNPSDWFSDCTKP